MNEIRVGQLVQLIDSTGQVRFTRVLHVFGNQTNSITFVQLENNIILDIKPGYKHDRKFTHNGTIITFLKE